MSTPSIIHVNDEALIASIKAALGQLINEKVLCVTADELTRQLTIINSKPFITVPEASLLLNCSEDVLYKQVRAARKNAAAHPIPFQDVGATTFPREELLAWAREHRPERKEAKPRRARERTT